MLAIVDHKDSFTYNLAQLFGGLGVPVRVVGSDALSLAVLRRERFLGVVLSPGPGHPDEAVASLDLVRDLLGRVPLLGVCLGHQILCRALGAQVVRARRPVHGESQPLRHDAQGWFAGLPNPLAVARYHSWVVRPDSLPLALKACAFDAEGQLMAVHHRQALALGLQFHPESFLGEGGGVLAERFVRSALGFRSARRVVHG